MTDMIDDNTVVYIIDDDEAICDSLQWLISGWGYKVRVCSSIQSFFANYDKNRPAALLVDVRLNGEVGTDILDILITKGYRIPVAFITGHGDVPMAVNSLKKGAIDFIQKPFTNDAIQAVIEKIVAKAPEYLVHQNNDARLLGLTTREQQVLYGIVNGFLNKQIADNLEISVKTVEAHRANIMTKMNVAHVSDLVKIVINNKPYEE